MKKFRLEQTKREMFRYRTIMAIFAILIAVTIIFSCLCYQLINRKLYNGRQVYLTQLTIKISEAMDVAIDKYIEVSEAVNKIVDMAEINDADEVVKELKETESVLEITEGCLAVINNNGKIYIADGATSVWEDLSILENAGEFPFFGNISVGDESKEFMIFVAALSTSDKADTSDTYLRWTALLVPTENLKNVLSVEGFGEECWTYITTPSGEILHKQTFSESFIEAQNILTALKDCKFTMGESLTTLQNALSDRVRNCIEFRPKNASRYYFVSTMPIGETKWSIVVFAPTDVVGHYGSDVLTTTVVYVSTVCVIIVIALAALIYVNASRHNERVLLQKEEESNKLLEEAAVKADSANKAKSEFLSHMSHDIRTPVNGIVGLTVIAKKNIDNQEKVSDCLTKIGGTAEHLSSLINDVLEMSRIESGRIEMAQKPIDILALVDNCCSMIGGHLAMRNLNFECKVGEIADRHVIGDEIRLREVLINILGNAVKFTHDEGSIEFRVEELPHEGNKAKFRFEIEDTGIGMSEEFIGRIFEPFAQEDADVRSDYQGTGLGMTITKRFVDLMNGSIAVRSEQNKGSCFTVEIPFEIAEAEISSPTSQIVKDLSGMRVLVVEDNEINREIVCEILRDEGVVLTEAVDGKAALDIFLASKIGSFDVILMDIMMPNMNGFEATKAIRASERSDCDVPIVAMTANAFVEDVSDAMDAGMNAHIAKPIDIQHLIAVLGEFYQSKKQ